MFELVVAKAVEATFIVLLLSFALSVIGLLFLLLVGGIQRAVMEYYLRFGRKENETSSDSDSGENRP